MDNAVSGFVVVLALAAIASLGVLYATSTGVLYYQEADQDARYTCHYVTATGTFTRSIGSFSGCKFLAAAGE